jgi:ankyrin repeat protein
MTEMTPLHYAAMEGKAQIVEILLANVAMVDARCRDGSVGARSDNQRTALHLAAARGHVDVTKLLMEGGADVNALGCGDTPFLVAVRNGHFDLMKTLVGFGANQEVSGFDGEPPLRLAAAHGNTEIVQLLLDEGADKEAKDDLGRTALMVAVEKGNLGAARCLIKAGAKAELLPSAKGHNTPKSLCWAAKQGDTELVRKLVDIGADMDERDGSWTPLHLAVVEGHDRVVQILVEGGVDKEALDQEGRTPLHLAVASDHPTIVEFLIESGADLREADQGWKTLRDPTPAALKKLRRRRNCLVL